MTNEVLLTFRTTDELQRGDPVYLVSKNICGKARADDPIKHRAIGLVCELSAVDESVEVITFGVFRYFTHCHATGTKLFLNCSGGVTTEPPLFPAWRVSLGYYVTATDFFVHLESPTQLKPVEKKIFTFETVWFEWKERLVDCWGVLVGAKKAVRKRL